VEATLPAKIITRIFGGLGNQLFCYSAARRLALVNDAELVIDDVSGFEHDHVYQRHYQLDNFNIPCRKASLTERLEPSSRVRRYLKRAVNRRRPFEARNYIQQEGIDFDARLLTLKPHGAVYLEGYWQSEQYFMDVQTTIREELRIMPPRDETNQAIADRIRCCLAVAVHVRFFDWSHDQAVSNVPCDYYGCAVNKMEALVHDAHYFVFSDQPTGASTRIPLPNDRFTLVMNNQSEKNAYADLWLMTQCQHFIIGNSTFSWWGAWLAEHAEKQVIAPGFEVREGKASWGFEGLLPPQWIKL